jgi:Uma2 family endonuclease
MPVQTRATLDDLSRVDGKAELIDGRVVECMPTGDWPSWISGLINSRILEFVVAAKHGRAYPDGIGFTVSELASGRESFSPEASYYDGPLPRNRMRFVQGPPTFAVEVRSEVDYGSRADAEFEAKRRDYFEAGTKVVWDVDPLAQTVTCYRTAAPEQAVVFRPGDHGDAEPALPGWRLDVGWLFSA